jgi:hypothetical protein
MSNRPDFALAACTAFVLMSGAVPGTAGTARAQTLLQKPSAYPARGQPAYQQTNPAIAILYRTAQASAVAVTVRLTRASLRNSTHR